MEKRAKALTWWREQRELQKDQITKRHLPFANHRYLTGDQIETLHEKENAILPKMNLNTYSLKQFIQS